MVFPMKILFLSDLWLPFPGGAERYVFNLARQVRSAGNEVQALTSYEKSESVAGIEAIRREILGQHTTVSKQEREKVLREQIKSLDPNVIFVHRFFAQEYVDVLRSFQPKIKLIEVVHQHRYIPEADFTIYNSEYTKSHNNSSGPHEIIIPPIWAADTQVEEKIDHRIGFVKPLEGKGAGLFYSIVEKFPMQQFLVLRGEWQSIEDYRPQLTNVKFIEPVKEMKEFYAQCDITLVPSVREDAGTIPQESAFNEIPCISSRTMGLLETNAGGIIVSHNYL